MYIWRILQGGAYVIDTPPCDIHTVYVTTYMTYFTGRGVCCRHPYLKIHSTCILECLTGRSETRLGARTGVPAQLGRSTLTGRAMTVERREYLILDIEYIAGMDRARPHGKIPTTLIMLDSDSISH
jgi:hypothetical protein